MDIQHSTWYRIYSLVMFILGGVFFVASKKNISNSLPPNFTHKERPVCLLNAHDFLLMGGLLLVFRECKCFDLINLNEGF